MAIKELQTRIALKYDSYANWTNADVADQGANLVLLRGELGICEIKATNEQTKDANIIPTVLFKVGDGETPFKDLPWASAKAADVYGWAKASDVVLEGKTIKFVGTDKTVVLNYATPEEVAAAVKVVADNLSSVDARVVALENKFTGDSSVQGQIDALDGRLDAIEGTEGAIATGDAATLEAAKGDATSKANTAEANAKAYAKEYADGIATEQAKTDAAQDAALEAYKTVVTGLLADKQDVIPAETYDAYGAAAQALIDAKAYADQAEADAITAAETASENKVKVERERIASLEAFQAAQGTKNGQLEQAIADEASARATAVSDEATARDNADKAIEAKIGGSFDSTNTVAKAISDAQTAAQSYVDGQVEALKKGDVAANAAAIEAMDAAYKKAVSDEAKARDDADKAIDERLDKVEAFFEGAAEDSEGLNNALDKLVDIQNYLAGEGSAADGLMGQVSANATAIGNLEDRMDDAEDAIEALQAKDEELASADTALGQRIDGVITAYAAADTETLNTAKSYADGVAATAESNAKTHAETKATAAETAAKGYADEKVAGLKTTLEAADEAIEAEVDKKLDKTTFEAHTTGDHAGTATAITAEIAAAVKVETDARVEAINGVNNKIGTIDGTVANAIAGVKTTADTAAADLAALTTRVGTAEGNITTLQGIVETGANSNANLRSAITDLQTLTGTDGAIRTEIAAAKKAGDDAAAAVDALSKEVATNKTDIATNKASIEAIQADYLKAADVYIFNCGSSTTVTHEAPKAE